MTTTRSISTQATAILTGLIAGSAIAFATTPARAFSFTTNYTAELSGNNAAKGNIMLNSATLSTGEVINNFSQVQSVKIVSNDLYKGDNTGAASADKGDKATIGLSQEKLTEAGAVTALGNLNLNSIIDTEDNGRFVMDLSFDKALDNLFIWERGQNSMLEVQALDAVGNLIGKVLKISSKLGNNQGTDLAADWRDAGFKIDTLEIGSAQAVASLGINVADFGLNGPISAVRFTSKAGFNGPDWKVVGSAAAVPEPASTLGLAAIGTLLVAARRRQAQR